MRKKEKLKKIFHLFEILDESSGIKTSNSYAGFKLLEVEENQAHKMHCWWTGCNKIMLHIIFVWKTQIKQNKLQILIYIDFYSSVFLCLMTLHIFMKNNFIPLCCGNMQCLYLLLRIFFLMLKDHVFNESSCIIYSL